VTTQGVGLGWATLRHRLTVEVAFFRKLCAGCGWHTENCGDRCVAGHDNTAIGVLQHAIRVWSLMSLAQVVCEVYLLPSAAGAPCTQQHKVTKLSAHVPISLPRRAKRVSAQSSAKLCRHHIGVHIDMSGHCRGCVR
jgi:hypothetical protein